MSEQITDTAGIEITVETVEKTRISGVWTFTTGGKSHPVVTGTALGEEHSVTITSLCGVRMWDRSFANPLPATPTCLVCQKLLPAALAETHVQEPLPEERSPLDAGIHDLPMVTGLLKTEQDARQPTPEDVLAIQDGAITVSGETAAALVQQQPPVVPLAAGDPEEDKPFKVTRAMVNEGLFTGAATVNVSGKVHSVVLGEYPAGPVQHTQCGVDVERRGHPVVFVALPAVITCGSCRPLAEARAASPFSEQHASVPQLLERVVFLKTENRALQGVVRDTEAKAEEFRLALEKGVTAWRSKRSEMGGKIAALEAGKSKAEEELRLVKEILGRAPVTRDDAIAEISRLRLMVARWRGIAGVLAWKFPGGAITERVITLTAMEWAAAYGELFKVDGVPHPGEDGGFEVMVSIRRPELGVTSENDG